MAMSATQNPQPVSKRLRLTSRGRAVDSPPATERDDMEMSAPPTARSVIASTVEDPPNMIQPSLLQDLQHELTLEPVVRNFGGHGVESESTESAHDVQEVLDAVPPVDAMAERAVAGPTDDSDHETGILWSPELFERRSSVWTVRT